MITPSVNLKKVEISPTEIRKYTQDIIDLINDKVPKSILKVFKRVNKFLYLTGNAYSSIDPKVLELVDKWFNDHGIILTKEIKFINQTKLTPIHSIIQTIPSYTAQKKRELYILAFPIKEMDFSWSRKIKSLNLYLKDNTQTADTIINLLDSLEYVFDKNPILLKSPLNANLELYFADSFDSWIYFQDTEINKKLFNRLFNSLV